MDGLGRDLRHAFHLLIRNPAFSTLVVVILALGIGANAAIFSVVNAVVLRPLPFPESSRIVRIWHTPPREQFSGMATFSVSPANYLDWRARSTAFEHMSVYGSRSVNLSGLGEPDALKAAAVSSEFFQVLRPTPIVGRLLGEGDDEPSRSHVVVLGEAVWKTRFGGDRSIVGQSIRLNGVPYDVVGVLPLAAQFPDWADVWIPLVWTPEQKAVRGNHNYRVIAQLRAGTDVRRAQAELTSISEQLERLYPADDKGWGAVVLPLRDDVVSDVRVGLLVLLGAVACVLLIACANLANLLLARVLGRSRELAIRSAIGASRARIVRQLLVESSVLALAGGAVGLLGASWCVDLIVKSFGTTLPRAAEVALDGRVVLFTFVVALVTGIAAGVAPAWRMTRGDANDALKQGMGRGGSHAGERRLRNVLVSAEVALALVLLVAAGLLIRTLSQLRAVDPGIDPRNVVTMTVMLPPTKYPTPTAKLQFFDEAMRRIRALPGVTGASAIDSLPLTGNGSTQPVAVEGAPIRPLSEQPEVAVSGVLPGYASTVGMRVLDGRDFSDTDRPGRPLVVLVSSSAARRFWPNQRAIGKRLTLGLLSNDVREVVGVVSDVKVNGLAASDTQTVYVPVTQVPTGELAFVVRTAAPSASIAGSVIGAVHGIDAEQPVVAVETMDEVIGESIAQQRFAMRLLTGFAALALALAAIGIYGVLSYTVRQRAQEIGIRIALGAAANDVVRMVLVEGLKPTVAGLVVGIAASAALGRLLTSLVFGVTPRDAATFSVVALVVLAVGIAACAIPAYRASRVDPLQALRAD